MIDVDLPDQARAADAADAPPLAAVALRWSPVVGRDERPIGFRLRLQGAPGVALATLLDALLAGLAADAAGMPQGLVLLAPRDVAVDESLCFWGAPRNVLLELDERSLAGALARESVAQAQKHGLRLALATGAAGGAWPPAETMAPFQYLVGPAAPGGERPPREAGLLVTGCASIEAVRAAFAAGANGVIGWPAPPPPPEAGGPQPQQRTLLELIRLVQTDADVGDIERVFKRDPMLAYMLLTLANSPAFMRRQPIASLAHAIQLLGYQRLVKWLVLLLVIASKHARALPAIYGAVLRGLLLENCAAAAGQPPRACDECFVVGAFSLLDRITGVALPRLLQDVQLPEAVAAALAGAGGPYARWLDLARAVEDGGGEPPAAEMLAALGLGRAAVNLALLRALATNDALQTLV